MYGYRVYEWGTAPVWEEIPDPRPAPGEVLVDVEACSVGLTVLNCINGDLDNNPDLLPRVPGHELIGRVVEAGPGADGALVGKRIAAYFYLVCGRCPACVAGRDPHCSNLGGWVGVHRDGGYAPATTLPARNAIVIPDELDPVAATVVPDAVATPVHVAARAAIEAGDRVVVFGAGGGVGIHMVQVAQHHGATVAGFDIADAKLAEVARLGAIAVRSDDFASLDGDGIFPDGRPTVVVDLLGIPLGTRWAIDNLAIGGRLISLTSFRDRPVEIESRELVFRELSLLGSRYSYRDQLVEAAELVATGAVEPIIGSVGGPETVPAMHAALQSGTLLGRGALDWRSM
ncbi:MAG: alcohol dehydrogenase catalytic domain-containing protein [Acidimicrobiia bacterium]|nr:alcohol dehydrogenase catalytic domain-containing protein [Acidimicrobiia bacterium]